MNHSFTPQYRSLQERHTLEHVSFPCTFYKFSKQILSDIKKGKSAYLMNLYNNETSEGKKKPYHSSDFAMMTREYRTNGIIKTIIRLTLPMPEDVTECRYIYLCHRPSTGDVMYFTSELSAAGDYYLCAWTRKHCHLLLDMGPCENEFDRVADHFDELACFEPEINVAI